MKFQKREAATYRNTVTVIVLSAICLFCSCSNFSDNGSAYKSESMGTCSVLLNADVVMPKIKEYTIVGAKMK